MTLNDLQTAHSKKLLIPCPQFLLSLNIIYRTRLTSQLLLCVATLNVHYAYDESQLCLFITTVTTIYIIIV